MLVIAAAGAGNLARVGSRNQFHHRVWPGLEAITMQMRLQARTCVHTSLSTSSSVLHPNSRVCIVDLRDRRSSSLLHRAIPRREIFFGRLQRVQQRRDHQDRASVPTTAAVLGHELDAEVTSCEVAHRTRPAISCGPAARGYDLSGPASAR
jgi:hypothetical protein